MKRTVSPRLEARDHAAMQRDGNRVAMKPVVRTSLTTLFAGLPPLDRKDGLEPVDRPLPETIAP